MRVGEPVELPVRKISTFIADLDPSVRIIEDGHALAGEPSQCGHPCQVLRGGETDRSVGGYLQAAARYRTSHNV